MAQKKYYLGKGKVRLFTRLTNGLPGAQLFWANAPELKLSISTEKKEHTESYSGANAVDNAVVIKSSAELSLTIDELTADIYQLLTKGTKTTRSTGAISNYVLDTPAVGKVFKLPGTGLTAVTIVDSTPTTPITVNPTKYAVDANFGTIEILNVSGVVGNWKVSATYETVDTVTMLSQAERDLFLHFEGINMADQSNVLLEVPLCRFEAASDVDFIGDDYGKFPMKAQVLADGSITSDPNFAYLGPYGNLTVLP
jgi:hypothetical protein